MNRSTPDLPITNSWSSLKLTSIEPVMPSSHLILCLPLLLLPSVSSSHQVAKLLEFHFSISPSNEYSGLISLRIDWLDFLAVQGILRSLLQHRSSKASVLWHSAFFMIRLSHPYLTTGKTIALTLRTFIDKAVSLLFNTLSRFVIVFLPRSKSLLAGFTLK